ncbi:MAG: L,D-transpeptidase [Rhodobiaceae bacterium]|nr:L,D-transpeptidase [Rhodobiaceae bacterium]
MRSLFAIVTAFFAMFLMTASGPARADWRDNDFQRVDSADFSNYLIKKTTRAEVNYNGKYSPGTIVVDTSERVLYLVLKDNRAIQYGIGVGREGFAWSGTHPITRKAEWPGWTPPDDMRKRQPWLPAHMEGGPGNPLGARALYLGSTLYRIHGTNEAHTIGRAVSSGCIRMLNNDVTDLYERVSVGTRVVVLN